MICYVFSRNVALFATFWLIIVGGSFSEKLLLLAKLVPFCFCFVCLSFFAKRGTSCNSA